MLKIKRLKQNKGYKKSDKLHKAMSLHMQIWIPRKVEIIVADSSEIPESPIRKNSVFFLPILKKQNEKL